jgi:peptide/nickel transport system ATP-binding protein
VELLGQCGLPAEYFDRYPHEVSGGQCQRAAIARALAIEPDVLICDEATCALDVTVQQQVMELLRQLQKTTGMSYIFICHNLALVQSFCTRLLVMRNGKIVEEGTPDEIIMNPQTDYAKQLVDSVL